MSKRLVQRAALLGLTSTIALIGAAQAVETKFGEVQITFDTTVSVGASVRTADRETQFLPEGNGGPQDPRDSGVISPLSQVGVGDLTPFPYTGQLQYNRNVDNFDGSGNTDDGRLNFDKGDLIGANVKANHDLLVKWQNYTFFARAVGFYDVVMNDHDVGERSELTDAALGDVGRNYELLDAFVSADYTIGELPVNLRVGKQVINWGESTFILGGNNVFNPIDVAAFRRPGSEIKEALVPVNALYGSISLPFDVSLSGYYALDWEPFEIDASGTPFSTADVVTLGSGRGGNEDRVSIPSSSKLSGMRRTCAADAAAWGNTALTGTLIGAGNTASIYDVDGNLGPLGGLLKNPNVAQAGSLDCLDSPLVRSSTPYPIGFNELTKLDLTRTLGSQGVTRTGMGLLSRDADVFARDDGQYGISAKYYAEWLGGTEFGAYYQNYHSRLPFISENARAAEIHVGPVGRSLNEATGHSSRFALPLGCVIDSLPVALGGGGQPAATTLAVFLDPRLSPAVLGQVPISDPEDILNQTAANAAAALGIALYNNPNPAIGFNNYYAAAQLNCALAGLQSGVSSITGRPTLFDGAEVLTAGGFDAGLFVEYPEDIETYGGSFNTTIMGWGVQGDFTYRRNAPFQVDTDSLTIAAAAAACAFPIGAADLASTFEARSTVPGISCFGGGIAPGANRKINGVIRNEMVTAQIGTTSTYTASDWWVDALGSDGAVVVTEVGMAFVSDVESTWLDKYDPDGANPSPADLPPTRFPNQYQNIGCQGSDLPLGALLGLDRKRSKQCRPNDLSAGLVFLARMDYNNAFNTGWLITPQIVYAYDFEGKTPAPYSTYLEDRQSLGLSVTGTLNNNLRVGASYSNFFGGHIANKAKDQDFASITASYTF